MTYATTHDGLRLAVHRTGSGVPVVLVMGLGMPGAVWAGVRDGLARDHEVVTYDNRGIGASDVPERPYAMADLGDDVARVMDALGWQSAHVVGVSMGGMAVQELALRHPERVRSLTLIATHSGGRTAVIPRPEGLLRVLQSRVGGRERRRRGATRLLFPHDVPIGSSPSVEVLVNGHTDARHQAAVRLQLRAVLGHRTRDRLASLAGIPTLVIRPDRDILCRPRHSDRLARDIPGAVLKRFPDAGHGIVHQCADALAEAIAQHVSAAHSGAEPVRTAFGG